MLLALLIATAASAAYPPPGYKLLRTEDSPRHSFVVETYAAESGTAVWLYDPRGHTSQLWARGGDTIDPYVYISPDERWIVCVQKLYHGASGAWLYERRAGIQYAELAPPSFGDAAWNFFRAQTQRSFEQSYRFMIHTGTWLPQSHSLLVELSGDDGQTLVRGWFCYYDLQKHRFYVDAALQKKNRDAVSSTAGQKRPNQALQPTAQTASFFWMSSLTSVPMGVATCAPLSRG